MVCAGAVVLDVAEDGAVHDLVVAVEGALGGSLGGAARSRPAIVDEAWNHTIAEIRYRDRNKLYPRNKRYLVRHRSFYRHHADRSFIVIMLTVREYTHFI